MDSFEYHSDIHDYLDGVMSVERLKEFERNLSADINLREEFEFIRSMRLALDVEQLIGESITAEDIVNYASDSSDMDDEIKRRISQSAANDSELEYLIKTARETITGMSGVSESDTSASKSTSLRYTIKEPETDGPLSRLWKFLFPQTLVLRSAMTYVAIVTLAIVGYWQMWDNGSRSQIFTLQSDQGLRGGAEEQTISLENSAKVLKIAFALPIDTSFKYTYELLAFDSSVIMTWQKWSPQTFDTLMVPTNVLPSGQYMLRVRESNQEGKLENQYILPFTVSN